MNKRAKVYDRWHNIFDPFEGLSHLLATGGARRKREGCRPLMDTANRILEEFNQASPGKGRIPSRFPDVAVKQFTMCVSI